MFDELNAFCIFIGYPRSGHSLIGALLNAHPDVVICHELDALAVLQQGASRRQLFEKILARDEEFAAQNRTQFYSYDIKGPGSFQGRWRRLQVIGDKKGSKTSRQLHDNPGLLDDLAKLVRLPLRIVHVVRSPWDNIATIARRDVNSPEAVPDYLPQAAGRYFKRCESIHRVREHQPDLPILDVYHEDFVGDPRRGLEHLSDFLGVERDEAWIETCRAFVYAKPHRSRFAIDWPEALTDHIRSSMERYAWLPPEYRVFGEPTPEELIVQPPQV